MDETTVSSAPKEIAADRLTAFKASLTKLFKEVCCVISDVDYSYLSRDDKLIWKMVITLN